MVNIIVWSSTNTTSKDGKIAHDIVTYYPERMYVCFDAAMRSIEQFRRLYNPYNLLESIRIPGFLIAHRGDSVSFVDVLVNLSVDS